MSLQTRAASIFAGLTFRLVLIGLVAAMFVNTYVDVRVPIPLLPDLHWEGWKPKAQRLAGELSAIRLAQKKAAQAQLDVNDAQAREWGSDAEESEDEKAAIDIAVRDAVAEYAGTHRVPKAPSCASGGTDRATEAADPDMAASVPADSGVLVSDATLQALSGASSYAVACHNWAVDVAD